MHVNVSVLQEHFHAAKFAYCRIKSYLENRHIHCVSHQYAHLRAKKYSVDVAFK